MSANPPKDDAWKPYDDIRFALVQQPGNMKPARGLILDWRADPRRRSNREALVTYFDDAALRPVVKTEWLPQGRLVPVPVDPNWTG